MKSTRTLFLLCIFLMDFWPGLAQSGSKQVQIPAGEFLMGTEEGTKMESPVHRVQLKNFYIDRHEVTNKEYETLRPNHQRSTLSACDNCPVTKVDWHDADIFCKHHGGRLPTEAEWERAARGTKGNAFSFGATADLTKGRFGLTFKDGASPVDTLQPNDFGLYHMSGNVWEWVADWAASYPQGMKENPVGPRTGDKKILRGGSWYNAAYYVDVAMRFELNPKVKINSIGFRCVNTRQQKLD